MDRKLIVEKVRTWVKDAMNRYQISPNEAVLFYDLQQIHFMLLNDMETKPFSAVRKTCLENFKSFFIDKYRGHQEIVLNRVYMKVVTDLNS